MNTKAQFWSVTGVLLVVLLVALTQTTLSTIQEEESSRVDRAQSHTFNAFAQRFEALDAPRILELSAQKSAREYALNQETLQTHANDHLDTLKQASPFIQEVAMDIRVESVTQATPRDIELTITTNHTITGQDRKVNNTPQQHTLTITPTHHPVYGLITDDWQEDTDEPCLASILTSSADCNGQPGITPTE